MTTLRFNQPVLKNFDLFLDNLLNNDFPVSGSKSFNFPAVNIIETNDDYQLEFNAPGRNKEDFKITIDKNILTVSFESKEENKEEETKEQNKKYIKKEFITQSFKRSFTLDEKINADAVDAKYENGILILALPKKEEVKVLPKEISIK